MSLVRLLTAGKSLIGLQNATSRYRLRTGYLLPKFGSDKNPFAAPPAVPPAAAEPIHEMSPAEIAAAHLKETRRLDTTPPIAHAAAVVPAKPVATETPPAPNPLPAVPAEPAVANIDKAPAILGGIGQLARKLNLAGRFKRGSRGSKSAVPRFNKEPVQGELSLDQIKVVRNDLSDADVELMPAKPARKAKARPAGAPAEPTVKAELAETPST